MRGEFLLRWRRYSERVKGRLCVEIGRKGRRNLFQEEEEEEKWVENNPVSIRKRAKAERGTSCTPLYL